MSGSDGNMSQNFSDNNVKDVADNNNNSPRGFDDTAQATSSNAPDAVDDTNTIQESIVQKLSETIVVQISLEEEDVPKLEDSHTDVCNNVANDEDKENLENIEGQKKSDVILNIINDKVLNPLENKKSYWWLFRSHYGKQSSLPAADPTQVYYNQGQPQQGGYYDQGPPHQGGYYNQGPHQQGGYYDQGVYYNQGPQVYFQGPPQQGGYGNQPPQHPRFQPPTAAELPPELGSKLEYTPDRNAFVRKVFTVVFIMLLVTSSFCVLVLTQNSLRKFMKSKLGYSLFILSMFTMSILVYYFCCICSRVFPCNIVLLNVTVTCYSYMAGFFCAKFPPEIVLAATATTTLVVLVCVFLAYSTIDFTKFIIVLMVASLAICFGSIIGTIICYSFGINISFFRLILMSLSACVQSVLLILELQMILGGKEVEIGENEWAYAAFMVYVSVIQLLLKFVIIINDIMEIVQ